MIANQRRAVIKLTPTNFALARWGLELQVCLSSVTSVCNVELSHFPATCLTTYAGTHRPWASVEFWKAPFQTRLGGYKRAPCRFTDLDARSPQLPHGVTECVPRGQNATTKECVDFHRSWSRRVRTAYHGPGPRITDLPDAFLSHGSVPWSSSHVALKTCFASQLRASLHF